VLDTTNGIRSYEDGSEDGQVKDKVEVALDSVRFCIVNGNVGERYGKQ
jgi:hypothetical protein